MSEVRRMTWRDIEAMARVLREEEAERKREASMARKGGR